MLYSRTDQLKNIAFTFFVPRKDLFNFMETLQEYTTEYESRRSDKLTQYFRLSIRWTDGKCDDFENIRMSQTDIIDWTYKNISIISKQRIYLQFFLKLKFSFLIDFPPEIILDRVQLLIRINPAPQIRDGIPNSRNIFVFWLGSDIEFKVVDTRAT